MRLGSTRRASLIQRGRCGLALLCGLAFALVGSASIAASGAEALLEVATTRDELSRHIGAQPYRCILGAHATELCAWHAGNRSKAWRGLAQALGTRHAVNVICQLPLDGGRRAAESCVVRPRRDQASVSAGPASRATEPAALAQARTVAEVSFLIGDVPWDCTIMAGGRRSWKPTLAGRPPPRCKRTFSSSGPG